MGGFSLILETPALNQAAAWAVSSGVEYRSYKPGVTGSNPVPPTIFALRLHIGHLKGKWPSTPPFLEDKNGKIYLIFYFKQITRSTIHKKLRVSPFSLSIPWIRRCQGVHYGGEPFLIIELNLFLKNIKFAYI